MLLIQRFGKRTLVQSEARYSTGADSMEVSHLKYHEILNEALFLLHASGTKATECQPITRTLFRKVFHNLFE